MAFIALIFFAVPADADILQGTLVLLLPTKDGILLMADRLATGAIDGKVHDINKLLQGGRFTAIASTGASIFYAEDRNTELFNASETAILELRDIVGLGGGIEKLAPFLAKTIATASKNNMPLDASRTAVRPDGSLFQTLLLHYNDLTRTYECPTIRFYLEEKPKPWLRWEILEAPPKTWSEARLLTFGEIVTFEDIRTGRQEDVKPFRSYLTDPFPSRKLTVKKGLLLMERAMLLAKQDTDKRGPSCIGAIVDAALLSPRTGFKWLYRKKILSKNR